MAPIIYEIFCKCKPWKRKRDFFLLIEKTGGERKNIKNKEKR